ncbi:zinc-ribbon domain-containing protein [Desulfovibrio sulfodismutans]|uniref:Zinc-ribbon domain-containing protein n=1 Tax=Desulfolutivibrio sulfodismutans TaxID=63561 RepID=A0A7K3NIY3_9BACT|nr:zinc ribbon domain-containing protein [Desulfolutivibrio sulfodismutans]NDY56162.1 zinc-ribbon domain-containing protein [Desulfolutivibrio sulfodismutans]QLA12403.1 zinc-ribbon domain-containing protein [Desulfolutivibrio sulfodismutans DSM 3696]
MICNRCGAENDDDLRFCLACGHKLRSRERTEPEPGGEAAAAGASGADDRREGRTEPGPGRDSGVFLSLLGGGRASVWGKLGLAWVVSLLLAAAAVWSLASGVYWPLYPLTGLAALLAWRRKL